MESLSSVSLLFIGRYRDSPGNAIKCTFDGQLKDIFQGYKPKQQRKMYYQQVVCCVDDPLVGFTCLCSKPVNSRWKSFVYYLIFLFHGLVANSRLVLNDMLYYLFISLFIYFDFMSSHGGLHQPYNSL